MKRAGRYDFEQNLINLEEAIQEEGDVPLEDIRQGGLVGPGITAEDWVTLQEEIVGSVETKGGRVRLVEGDSVPSAR